MRNKNLFINVDNRLKIKKKITADDTITNWVLSYCISYCMSYCIIEVEYSVLILRN